MKGFAMGLWLVATCAGVLGAAEKSAGPAKFDVHVFVNDTCILADEPFYLPPERAVESAGQPGAKFLPLLGVVVGKFAELLVSHELQAAAGEMKAKADRKDTHYALTRQMNLYRAELATAPSLSLNSRLGCMSVVAAALQPDGTDCTSAYVPKTLDADSQKLPPEQWRSARQDTSVENQLRRANVCVAGEARAVYEVRFEFSADGTAYRLRNAGFQINSLLTTDDRKASRTALYTLKVSQPGRTDDKDVLTSAWVDLGTVSAGARSDGGGHGGTEAPWLQVPPLSIEARRTYEEKTRTHQQVSGEIEALERAITRNRRMLASLEQRIPAASTEVAAGLRQQRTKLSVDVETQQAELDARKSEYQELPRAALEFMPVTVEVAITETESAKKAQLALAELVGSSSASVASTVGSAASTLVTKSVGAGDLKLDGDAAAPQEQLDDARARYFDAWVAARFAPAGDATASRDLAAAQARFNAVRRGLGLGPIQ